MASAHHCNNNRRVIVLCWDRKDFVPSSMWTKRMRRFWKMQWSREACTEICPDFRGLESSTAITFHTWMEFGFWGPHTGKKKSNLQGCSSLLLKIWVCLNDLGQTPKLMVCHHGYPIKMQYLIFRHRHFHSCQWLPVAFVNKVGRTGVPKAQTQKNRRVVVYRS